MGFPQGERRIMLSMSKERKWSCNAVNCNLGREWEKVAGNCCVASKAPVRQMVDV
jgi:hypothetical protein